MQAYGRTFSKVYNRKWNSFSTGAAPRILELYSKRSPPENSRNILDLCCGTGQLASYFLDKGFFLTGIDLSPDMLFFARENSKRYVECGQAAFIEGDASSFALDKKFGLVTSIFDALNHLESVEKLRSCFESVRACIAPGGLFVFDLNTRFGLSRWNGVHVEESDDECVVTRGFYTLGDERAYLKVSGFTRARAELYERFEETMFNTVFDLSKVKGLLQAAGFKDVMFSKLPDLGIPVSGPEKESRVFVVAGA